MGEYLINGITCVDGVCLRHHQDADMLVRCGRQCVRRQARLTTSKHMLQCNNAHYDIDRQGISCWVVHI